MVRRIQSVKEGDDDSKLGLAIVESARSLGWLLPETEQQVAAEEENLEDVQLPPSLLDPYAVLDRVAASTKKPRTDPASSEELEQELARAAREGAGQIPAEVEDQMKRDREAAEHAGHERDKG